MDYTGILMDGKIGQGVEREEAANARRRIQFFLAPRPCLYVLTNSIHHAV